MKNKKITSLLVAGALTVGIVGGTLAWLTANDSVTNKFDTTNVTGKQVIDIYEKFNAEEAKNLYPNAQIDKKVQVKNVSGVKSFIRVEKPVVKDANGKVVADTTVALNYVNDNGTPNDTTDDFTFVYDSKKDKDMAGKWVLDGDYYYYMGIVEPGEFTQQLLDNFKILQADKDQEQVAMNGEYHIDIVADSIQASNDAYLSSWENASYNVKEELAKLQTAQTPNNGEAITGAEATK